MKKKTDQDGRANALATLLRVDFDLRELIHEVADIGGLSSLRQALTMQADKIDAVARWMNGEKKVWSGLAFC